MSTSTKRTETSVTYGSDTISIIRSVRDERFFNYRVSNGGGTVDAVKVGNTLEKTYTGSSAPEIDNQIERDINVINHELNLLSKAIDDFNQRLPIIAEESLKRRRETVEGQQKIISQLKVPIRPRENPLVDLPALKQKLIPVLPETNKQDEPQLLLATYEHILQICTDMALAMEQSPDVFVKLKTENEFRVLFLVLLNGNYEGAVTAETFNLSGKTDICFKHKGRNLFVAECKIWGGTVAHKAAIDQLLSYTQWRGSKTAIMVFVNEQDFSGIKEKIFSATKAHPNYLEELSAHNTDTSRRYRFSNKEDSKQTFLLTVMAFHIRSREPVQIIWDQLRY